jgi:hypothetical protein
MSSTARTVGEILDVYGRSHAPPEELKSVPIPTAARSYK